MLLPNATQNMLLHNATENIPTPYNRGQSLSNAFKHLYQSAAIAQNLTKLPVPKCVQAYSSTLETKYGNLILVTKDTMVKPEKFFWNNYMCPNRPGSLYPWLCGSLDCRTPCNSTAVDTAHWGPFGHKIEYCIAEKLADKCKVQLTPTLAYMVVIVNFLKAAALILTFLSVRENPMMTIGDAVASFLHRKDQTTKNLCLMGKEDIKLWIHAKTNLEIMHVNGKRRRWGSVISKSRWTVFILL
jgi:hypothetical protein